MRFKKLLKEAKVTQSELAKILGVHQTLISQWCNGQSKPGVDRIEQISIALNQPIETVVKCFSKDKEE